MERRDVPTRQGFSRPQKLAQRPECAPSQNGACFECLQPHHATVFSSAMSARMGTKPVPLCEPSQNGWFFELPQAHHQYEAGLTFCTNGNV